MEAESSEVVDTSFVHGRKWLALRMLLISIPANVALWMIVDLVDRDRLFADLPRWLQIAGVLPAVAGLFGLGYLVLRGGHDLLWHVLPEGKFKTAVVGDNALNEQPLKEFPELAHVAAYAPLMVIGLYLVLALVAAFAIGGVAAVAGIWNAMAGWPSWAIVITVLLVLVLLKPTGSRGR